MFNEEFLKDIATEAELLKHQYTEEALFGLLDAEQTRLEREKKITLGKSPKDLAKGALLFLGDKLKENRILTNALLMTYVVNNVIEYLIAQGVITSNNASRERFVISLVVAIVMDSVYKQWEKYRTK